MSNTFSYIEAGHEVDSLQFEPGVPLTEQALRHDLDILFLQLKLDARYGLTDWFELGGELPMRMTVIDALFTDANGDELPEFSSIHHRDEAIVGIADPALKAYFHALRPKTSDGGRLIVSVGVTLPVGGIEKDPFTAGEDGENHQHMFFGYGVFAPKLGVNWTQPFSGWSLGGWFECTLGLYANEEGYKPPSLVLGGLGVQSSFGLENWWFGLEPRLMIESPAEWESRKAENSGRTDLLGALMAGVGLGENWGLSVEVQTTLASFSQEGNQMTMPFVGTLSLMWGMPVGQGEK